MNAQSNTAIAMFAALLACGMLVANGCDMRQLVKVDAPPAVLETLDVEGPISLAEADLIYADWQAWVTRNTERFERAVQAADERYRFVHQWISIGMDAAGTASEGIPYGGLLFGALTGAVGLMLPQPKLVAPKKDEPKA
jgi:hypothetical protein